MKTTFYKIATNRTTIDELSNILEKNRSSVLHILAVLNNRMDIAFSGLDRYINISLLQNDVVAMTSYPSSYIGKYVKINDKLDIDKLYGCIMDDNYYVNKLILTDPRPTWYYSLEYNKKSDEFSDDIIKEFNFK
jgi:hypothetical protein